MKIEKLTIRDLQEVKSMLPEGRYDTNMKELIDNIQKEGFQYKAVDATTGKMLAGFIAYLECDGTGYISEVMSDGSFVGRKGLRALVAKFNEDMKCIPFYFEVHGKAYMSKRVYVDYYKSEYIDIKLYTGN